LPPGAWFYFDLSSPEAYLAAERILHVLPAPAEWMPVLASELPGRGASQGEPHDESDALELLRGDIARRARELGLQPLRWPSPFPFDSALAMRAATYAKSIGRTVPFAQAAFRQAFAGGHSLQEVDHVLIAAAACEMHPAAVLRGTELRSVERQLSRSTARAAQAGILDVPAVLVGGEPSASRVLFGARAVEEAAAHMTSLMSSAPSGPPAPAGSR
jgi:2-hydroxychromene-2-carboxylate isomerase